jgi:nicotinate-nucleotide pyrophosphorylase (carboxylating)
MGFPDLDFPLDTDFPYDAVRRAVAVALAEDATGDDITTRWSVPAGTCGRAVIMSRQRGVVAGLTVVEEVYRQVDPSLTVSLLVKDGHQVEPGTVLAELAGSASSIISGERTALNFLQRMCGIATMAAAYVNAVTGFPTRILDTRKTAPGLRSIDKYAVALGGAHNHRLSLAAMVLLKENHIAAAGGITAAISLVREGMAREQRDARIEVEVRTVAEAREALAAGASWIMMDNMTLDEIVQVVAHRDAEGREVLLEASGNVSLDRVRAIAGAGADAISVGALTHSVKALDLTLLLRSDGAAR